MRAIHVVPAIGQEASGPSYSVRRLCESLIATGTDVRLASLDWADMANPPAYLERFPMRLGPRRLGVAPAMRRWLEAQATSGRIDIIHNHSLWMMPNVYAGTVCRRGRCRLLVSPRGTLSRWALRQNRLQKQIFWRALQGPAVRVASCFHATSDAELNDIRQRGLKQPVCVIPNGVDVPPLERTPEGVRRKLLFLGRIHPVKGVGVLLRAWRSVEHRFPDWELDIAGPDERGHLTEMQRLAAELCLKRVMFCGQLRGRDKWGAYRGASLFVLPTQSENFGMTVAESLAAGTPAIVTRSAPWNGLVEHQAGWWIESGVDSLTACFEDALSASPDRLAAMGKSGHDWMRRDFSWTRIASTFADTYCWMVNGGDPPQCVRLN